MKHILVNQNGQEHAVILACPFKYTLPRYMTVYEDNPTMGKLPVDTYHFQDPKPQDDVNAHAIDFAIVRDGVIESVMVWGGAEWCPPFGTTIVPVDQWIGTGDYFDQTNQKFEINENRIGKADADKTVAELQADADAIELQIQSENANLV